MITQTSKIIVVGCDGSWHSHRAVSAAALEAVRRNADLVVLSVPSRQDLRAERLDQVSQRERDALATAHAMAAGGLALARDVAPDVRSEVAVCALGSPALAELLAACDLLVLGGHGRGGQRAFSLGSTSAPLARAAASPVLVVAADEPAASAPQKRQVVVALDGQSASLHALTYAMTEASLRDAPLVVVRAVLPTRPDIAGALATAERECADAVERSPVAGPGAEVVVTPESPLAALLAACTPATLLVIGNRGVGRITGPVGGSLTERLLAAVPCDVVIVPTPATALQPEHALGLTATELP
jgi:nucleotide-binding universal stress UspA family protein